MIKWRVAEQHVTSVPLFSNACIQYLITIFTSNAALENVSTELRADPYNNNFLYLYRVVRFSHPSVSRVLMLCLFSILFCRGIPGVTFCNHDFLGLPFLLFPGGHNSKIF